MPVGRLQPPPIQDVKNLPFSIQEWFRQIFNTLQNGPISGVTFNGLDFTGSNMTSILIRNHNDLQNKQGGSGTNFYHITRILEGIKSGFAFGLIGSVANATTTLTITGAQTGDQVIVSPSGTMEAGISISAYVSATDTVTIVATNPTAAGITMAARSYNVTILKA